MKNNSVNLVKRFMSSPAWLESWSGGVSIQRGYLISIGIPTSKIQHLHNLLTFIKGTPIPQKTVFILKQSPVFKFCHCQVVYSLSCDTISHHGDSLSYPGSFLPFDCITNASWPIGAEILHATPPLNHTQPYHGFHHGCPTSRTLEHP